MSALGDYLADALFRGDEPRSFSEMVTELVQRRGVSGAAKDIGVHRRTLQRWRAGSIRSPKAATQERVTKASRASRLKSTTPTDSNVTLKTTERSGRRRNLKLGEKGLITPGTMDRVKQVGVDTGNKEAMARAFIGGVTDDFYSHYLSEGLEHEGGLDDDYQAVTITS